MSGLTYRDTKLSELTHDEVDENFRYLEQKADLYEVGQVYRGPVYKIYNGQLYLLSPGVTFPFTAANFVTELAAGNWQLVGSGTSYKGELNLTTPVLENGTGTIGDYYKVVQDGDYDFGAGEVHYNNGDFVLYDGAVYGPYVDNNQLFSSLFNKKDFDKTQSFTATGTDVVIPFHLYGYGTIELSGALTSVSGFSFIDLIASPENAEYPHEGKEIVIINRSGHDITLKNEDYASSAVVFFKFDGASNIIIPNNGKLRLKNNIDGLQDIIKSWVDISGKLDKVTSSGVERVYIINADGSQSTKPTSELLSEILITNATVTGTYNIDYSAGDVWDLTLTGNTTLTESNAPSSGKTKTITLEVSGNFTLSYPSSWTSGITGAYSGTATLNTITIQTFGSKRKVLIVQPT